MDVRYKELHEINEKGLYDNFRNKNITIVREGTGHEEQKDNAGRYFFKSCWNVGSEWNIAGISSRS